MHSNYIVGLNSGPHDPFCLLVQHIHIRWPDSKLAIFNFLHQSMCECIVCALSVLRQVAKKLGFLLLLQCAVCWCTIRGLWICKYGVYCVSICFFCVHGKKVTGPHEKILKGRDQPVHLKDLDCSSPLLYTQASCD